MSIRISVTQPPLFLCNCLFFSLNRFYTHDQALEAIFQSQRTVLGDNVLKVSSPSLHVADAEHGKTSKSASELVMVLLLIG